MKLRPGNLRHLRCQRRDSREMLTCPPADKDVIEHLEKLHPRALVHVESWLHDRARLEHSYWCHSADWHVANYEYVVDDETGKVYIVTTMEGDN
jgi:hypothetical protein